MQVEGEWTTGRMVERELQDGAALVIRAERFGRRVEAHTMQVRQERVYRGCPGPGSSADGVAHFDGGAQVAAEGLFLHTHILSAFSGNGGPTPSFSGGESEVEALRSETLSRLPFVSSSADQSHARFIVRPRAFGERA
jgi:hypothetical protein